MMERANFATILLPSKCISGLPTPVERREDIPALVQHFVEVFRRLMGQQIEHIPQETMSAFSSHAWPGNIRELQT